MDEQRGLSKRLQRAGHILILLCVILAGSVFFTKDAVAGYTATLESGDIITFYCFNAKNK